MKRNCYVDTDLEFLVKISETISHSRDIYKELEILLEELCQFLDAKYSMITIVDYNNEKIMISAAYGLSKEAKSKGVYKFGEGIVGKVVETKESVVIKDITKESDFLNKTGITKKSERQMAFICVPIIVKDTVMGTLSIHKLHDNVSHFTAELKFLNVVGMLIGRNLSIRRKHFEELEELRRENEMLSHQTIKPDNIIGNSSMMIELYQLIERVAHTNSSVMIRGESGVGKELIAEAIHKMSQRADKPFVKVNC
jgi:Nif-specific regulatory protein